MKAGRLFSLWFGIVIFSSLLAGCKPDTVDAYGRKFNVSDFRGKWVVVNYWATWCSPCIQEVTDLIKLQRYYRDKVVVFGVNPDNLDNSVLKELAGEYQVNYPFTNNFRIERWAEAPTKLPTTFIFSPNGRLYQTLYGPVTLANFQTLMNLPDISYP